MENSTTSDMKDYYCGIKTYLGEKLEDLNDVYFAHKQALKSCEEEITKWKKFIRDYDELKRKLITFPNKTSYETMVPLGSLAYMKGRHIHTNEVLVHLGDNWFAERSVKDALAIIDRRTQVCRESLQTAERSCEIHKGWLQQTQKMAQERGKFVDIIEEMTEEEYEEGKERHREMLCRHSEALKQDSAGEEQTSSVGDEGKNFEDLLKRLDELEEEEKVKDELVELEETIEGEEDSAMTKEGSGREKEKLQRRVSWADQIGGDIDDEEDGEESPESETIKIKYQSSERRPTEEESGEDCNMENTLDAAEETTPSHGNADQSVSPQSPRDIEIMFGGLGVTSPGDTQRKGILKKKGESFAAEESERGVGWKEEAETVTYIPKSPDEYVFPLNPPLSESPREIKKLKPAAFSYKVVPREEEQKAAPSGDPQEEQKISRFKSSRMNK